MKLGFIGTGAISEATIAGLCGVAGFTDPIVVSERSAARSARLAEKFANVSVEPDNQAIVDRCDWIVVAVLPEQTRAVLEALAFRAEQRIVSLVAGVGLAALGPLAAPATRITRAIPMPPIERGIGPIPICPPDPEVAALFGRVGTPIQAADERPFHAVAASGALMASFFELQAVTARWLERQGLDREEAANGVTSMFLALATLAADGADGADGDADRLQALSADCQTKGGINEQVIRELAAEGWFGAAEIRIGRILERLEGTS